MACINRLTLKRQREKLGLSLDDLAARSRIDKGTIHRIEAGRLRRNTRNTIDRLAKALKLAPDELTAAKAEDANGTDAILFSRSQFNVRISHEARNALVLVGQRYGVGPSDIIELAPLLFHLAAEESLRDRRQHLKQLREARAAMAQLQVRFPHIHPRLTNDWQGEEMELAEEESIAKLDIRARTLDEDEQLYDIRSMEYEQGEQNPFAAYLRERLLAVGDASLSTAHFDAWHEGWGPRYLICKEEAAALFHGDEEVADEVLLGTFGLHEIPKELRSADAAAGRLAWARERIRDVRERQVQLLETLDIKDLQG